MINKEEFKKCDLIFTVSLLIFIICAVYANTLKKEAEIQFKKELILANSDTDNLPYPHCVRDLNGNYVSYNKSYKSMVFDALGVECDMIGRSPDEVFNNGYKIWDKNDSIVFSENRAITFNEFGLDTNNNIISVELTKYPVLVNDSLIGIGTIANIKY